MESSVGVMCLASYIFFALFSWFMLQNTQHLPLMLLALAYTGWCASYLWAAKQRRQLSYHSLIVSGVALRCLFLFLPEVLTGDLPRYLWEGMLVRNGVSPYVFAPTSPELDVFAATYRAQIEYPHLSAIYPPLAEYLLACFAYNTFLWKLFLTLLDYCNLSLLYRLLHERKLPPENIVFYSLLPLPLLEIAGSGHLEGVFVTCLLGALLVRRAFLRGLLFGAGALVKYNLAIGVFYEALFLLRKGDRKASLYTLLGALFILVLLFSPYFSHLSSVFSSFTSYIEHWRFNDSLLSLLGRIFDVDWTDNRTFNWLKMLLAVSWTVLLLFLLKKNYESAKFLLLAFSTFLLFTATVHPWYGLWFAPLLVLYPLKPFIALALTLPLSYSARFLGLSQVPDIILLCEYIPVYVLILHPLLRSLALPPFFEKK